MRNILTNLDLRKSVGIDNISTPTTCICTDHYRRNKLFHHDSVNTHLVEGQYNIIPVNKKGSKSEKIQSSPCFHLSYVFKSLWEDWLWSNICCNNPFAFSKSLWIFEGSLLLYCSQRTEDWRGSLDVKESVTVVAVDLSKAFDSVRHNLLLAKLKAHGFLTTATNLIREYLKERRREG